MRTKAPLGSVQASRKEETHEPKRSAAPEESRSTPVDEATTLWKRLKHLATRLTTEEIVHADGTSKRVTRVLRASRM